MALFGKVLIAFVCVVAIVEVCAVHDRNVRKVKKLRAHNFGKIQYTASAKHKTGGQPRNSLRREHVTKKSLNTMTGVLGMNQWRPPMGPLKRSGYGASRIPRFPSSPRRIMTFTIPDSSDEVVVHLAQPQPRRNAVRVRQQWPKNNVRGPSWQYNRQFTGAQPKPIPLLSYTDFGIAPLEVNRLFEPAVTSPPPQHSAPPARGSANLFRTSSVQQFYPHEAIEPTTNYVHGMLQQAELRPVTEESRDFVAPDDGPQEYGFLADGDQLVGYSALVPVRVPLAHAEADAASIVGNTTEIVAYVTPSPVLKQLHSLRTGFRSGGTSSAGAGSVATTWRSFTADDQRAVQQNLRRIEVAPNVSWVEHRTNATTGTTVAATIRPPRMMHKTSSVYRDTGAGDTPQLASRRTAEAILGAHIFVQ